MKKGFWYALGAYFSWGLLPVYWKLLHGVAAVQVIGHRIVWSFIMLILFLSFTRQIQAFWQEAAKKKVLIIYFFAAILIGVNWFVYVWAVNANYIVETSLGYFINPLVSMLMGVFILGERLRKLQWVSVILAASGVIYLTVSYGRLPWIALTLAASFGLYGLVKKLAPLGSLYGLAIETGILFIPALIYLLFTDVTGGGAFVHAGISPTLLLIGAGAVTTIPLLMFASAAQNIPLSMVGVMQYIAPTMQFLLGVIVYKETFARFQLVGFGFVWLACLLFVIEGLWTKMKKPENIIRTVP